MSYPSNMSYKGIVDWATNTSTNPDDQNDINATLLAGKTLAEITVQPLDQEEMTEILNLLS